jgi:D-glycero-alpha-D-manno-heptose-7-phosphate kinase
MPPERPLRIIHARAPLRINDIGGWTDTWFSGGGEVLNLAVNPPVEVQLGLFPNRDRSGERCRVHAENFNETFDFDPDHPAPGRHGLLQFTLAAIPVPERWRLEVRIHSPVPAGISTGTSASVAVALLAALALAAGRRPGALRLAALAHRVETARLGQQSGVQDQICAARGGVSYIRLTAYPRASVRNVRLRREVWDELDRRLILVYLGRPHRSSAIHEQVIARLGRRGSRCRPLEDLKGLAARALGELSRADLEAYGRTMIRNNECQRSLFRKLISPEADEVIRLARKWNASGWKVNGAGGQGGSLTLLAGPDDGRRRRLEAEILSLGRGIRPLPASLCPSGVTAWRSA